MSGEKIFLKDYRWRWRTSNDGKPYQSLWVLWSKKKPHIFF